MQVKVETECAQQLFSASVFKETQRPHVAASSNYTNSLFLFILLLFFFFFKKQRN